MMTIRTPEDRAWAAKHMMDIVGLERRGRSLTAAEQREFDQHVAAIAAYDREASPAGVDVDQHEAVVTATRARASGGRA